MQTTELRDLVAGRIDIRWDAWVKAHPHLASAIDRVRLTESAVARLRDDPAFVRALAEAQADGNKLEGAVRLVELVERWVGRLMPL